MQRKLIVFDFDGTLVDSHNAFAEGLKEFSEARGLPHDINKMATGYVDPYKFDLGWGLPLAEQRPVFDDLNDYIDAETTQKNRFIPTLYEHVTDILPQLAEMYDLAVVTARHRTSFQVIIKYYGFDPFFPSARTACCARERGYSIKPAPDALHCLLNETGHKHDNVIMIGDTTADIGMANAAGVKSIAVLWGYHTRDKLAVLSPLVYAEKVNELPRLVDQLFDK